MKGHETSPIAYIVSSYNDERKILAQCLFFICYQVIIAPEDSLNILKLLQEICVAMKSKKKEKETEVLTDSEGGITAFTLYITIICFLDTSHELYVPSTGDHSLFICISIFTVCIIQQVNSPAATSCTVQSSSLNSTMKSLNLGKTVKLSSAICTDLTPTSIATFQGCVMLLWGLFLNACLTEHNVYEPANIIKEEVIAELIDKAVKQVHRMECIIYCTHCTDSRMCFCFCTS
jgi:hypothetical protein